MDEIRWLPEAVEVLEALSEEGLEDIARSIIAAIVQRLEKPPRPHRRVRIRHPESGRFSDVQVILVHPRRLPSKVYYRYRESVGVVEIMLIRHAKQRPIEL